MAAKSIVFPAEKGLLDGAIFVPINLLPWRSGCSRSTVANLLHINFNVELQLFCLLFFLILSLFLFFFFFFFCYCYFAVRRIFANVSVSLSDNSLNINIDYNQSKRQYKMIITALSDTSESKEFLMSQKANVMMPTVCI